MSATQTVENGNRLSQAERESMLMSVQKLIASQVRRAQIPEEQHDDVKQDCQLLLWEKTKDFDPNRGVKWSTYAHACLNTFFANRRVMKHCEEGAGRVVFVGHDQVLDHIPDPRSVNGSHREPDELEEGEAGDNTMSALATTLQRTLAEGVLDKLAPGHRRLVELVAFEGLTADQIAIQDGHPVKAVRTNLKAALRRLCALGLTHHAVSDKAVAVATAPKIKMTEAEREKHKARCRKASADKASVQVVANLEAVAAEEGFTVELEKFDTDTQVIVASLLDRSLSLDQAVELMGVSRKAVFNRLRRVAKAVRNRGISAQVDRSELEAR